MRLHLHTVTALLLFVCLSSDGHAEVLVRWTQDRVPPPQVLGVPGLAVPAGNGALVRNALAQGYRIYLELDVAALAAFTPPPRGLAGVVVKGTPTPAQVAALRKRLASASARVLTADKRGKWPHIRSNWVTRDNEVLQVAGRSAQPWIETNAALIRMANATNGEPPVLTYEWAPSTPSENDEGPAVENYLIAIAEAGSFGADLLLPVHERFQRRLLLGHPEARRDWDDIRRYLDFYAGDLPRHYQPIASIGIVTSAPMVWFEVMNLLARHNLPFELIDPLQIPVKPAAALKLLIVLDEPGDAQKQALAEFERNGGRVKVATEVADPNRFALDVRRLLGRDGRVVDVWNGITIVAAPFKDPDGSGALLTMVNYAHQPLPVQVRVPGTFARVHYESPDEPSALLPHRHLDTHTEFVIPAVRVGGRIFLTR